MKIGLVLSGGGARGVAHIGALKALREMGIVPFMISGVSAGAWTGAFYGAGYNPKEMEALVRRTRLFRLRNLAWSSKGVMRASFLRRILERYTALKTFEELKIRLVVEAADFIYAKSIYFQKGELITPLIASASIPFLFQPVRYEEKWLVDGGLLNNFPVEPLIGKCDVIIGINVNPVDTEWNRFEWRGIIQRSLQIAIENTVHFRKDKCDVFLEPPPLSKYGLFDFERSHELVTIGYDYVMKHQKRIEEVLKQKSLSNKSVINKKLFKT